MSLLGFSSGESSGERLRQRPQSSVPELIADIQELTAEIQQLYRQDALPWIIGYSGGKDSTVVLQLVWNAIAALSPDQRTKTIHVITTDTLVENPVVAAWVSQSLDQMKVAAQAQKMPVEPLLLKPAVKDTFWVPYWQRLSRAASGLSLVYRTPQNSPLRRLHPREDS